MMLSPALLLALAGKGCENLAMGLGLWLPLAHVKGWLAHGGYVALGALVLAGNVGLPVPENTVL